MYLYVYNLSTVLIDAIKIIRFTEYLMMEDR